MSSKTQEPLMVYKEFNAFSDAIDYLCGYLGLTISELTSGAGWSPHLMADYRAGRALPSYIPIEKLNEYLDNRAKLVRCGLRFLLYVNPNPYRPIIPIQSRVFKNAFFAVRWIQWYSGLSFNIIAERAGIRKQHFKAKLEDEVKYTELLPCLERALHGRFRFKLRNDYQLEVQEWL